MVNWFINRMCISTAAASPLIVYPEGYLILPMLVGISLNLKLSENAKVIMKKILYDDLYPLSVCLIASTKVFDYERMYNIYMGRMHCQIAFEIFKYLICQCNTGIVAIKVREMLLQHDYY